jgi:SAM-dependent methyltransferase
MQTTAHAPRNDMTPLTHCRMCGSAGLYRFLDLGSTPPADRFMSPEQLSLPEHSYPLEVVLCDDCGLAQLNVVVSGETLYCEDYPYESSTTAAGAKHWREFAETTAQSLKLTGADLVVDVGSNVGVLLSMFKEQGTRVLGVDPADNIAQIARDNGIDTVTAFFNSDSARKVAAEHGKATVITGTNVFAHIDDLNDFMQAVDHLLNERGVLIVEMPYYGELLQNLEYDTIYHEHLSYISLKPIKLFFERHGMEVFEVQRRDIHGGSFRVFARRQGSSKEPVASIVGQLLEAERRDGIHSRETADKFATGVAKNRDDLRQLLDSLKAEGKRVVAVSAPAKGMTLLNYCGLDEDYLDFVTEKSRLKIGRYTPGVRLKVLPDDALLSERPDYALLLAWNFSEEIMRNLKEYSAQGGKFIIPIPTPRIVG